MTNFDVDTFIKNLEMPAIHQFLRGQLKKIDQLNGWKAILSYQPRIECANPMGQVQGGIICSMLDDAMGLFSLISNQGKASVTMTMNISFLRPCYIEPVDVEVYFVRQGRKISNIESIAYQNGKEVAKASAAFTLI